jgi:hypothetical protein
VTTELHQARKPPLFVIHRLYFVLAPIEAVVSSALTSSSFLCSQFLNLWTFVACPRSLRRSSCRRTWRVPLGFFSGHAKDLSKITLFPSPPRCLQFGEPWLLGPYSRAPASLPPPAMARTPRGPLRGRVLSWGELVVSSASSQCPRWSKPWLVGP